MSGFSAARKTEDPNGRSRRRRARASADDTPVIGRGGSTLSPTAGTAVAVVCLLGAAAIVLYGLYVIVF